MKNTGILILIIIVGLILYYGFRGTKSAQPSPQNSKSNQIEIKKEAAVYQFPGVLPDDKIRDKKAVLETSKGKIEFELYADKAPKTVSNFVYLAEKGFYSGLSFHRVVPGFVVQGGDPQGNGAGGPGYKFADEPVSGDYKEGTVAMANSGPDTNGSQFFICLADQPTLPRQYNLFGQVKTGMEVAKKIAIGDKINKVTIENL